MMRAQSKVTLILTALFCLSFLSYSPKALAGSATITENKAVITGPTPSEDFIIGGKLDLLVTEGYYNASFVPAPKKPIFAFAETDLQLGYMFPVIGRSFYRGNFEALADLFLWESTREHSGILGGGALGVHYNFVHPGWRLVPYIGGSLGLSGNDLYVQRSQQVIGGPFEFVLQANVGARYFVNRNWGFIIEGGFQHVSNDDLYPRNVGVNQTGGRFGVFCLF